MRTMFRTCVVLLAPFCLAAVGLAQGPPGQTPNLAARVAAVEAAVADLQDAAMPLELTVNCSAGETVTAALDKVGLRPGWVTITVVGTCTERVRVRREGTTIRGASPTDGLRSPSGSSLALILRGWGKFNLENLTVHGTITAGMGQTFLMTGVTITECAGGTGLSVSSNASGVLGASTITGCSSGVAVSGGGDLEIADSVIDGNGAGFMGVQVSGGQVTLTSNTVVRNFGSGFGLWVSGGLISASATEGQFVRIEGNYHGVGVNAGGAFNASSSGVVISGNVSVGVAVMMGGSAWMNGIRVADTSAGPGMFIRGGGHITLGQGAIVENNAKGGVSIQNMGVGDFQGAIIRNNRGNGIGVNTVGLGLFFTSGPPTQVLDNERWGVGCDGPPDVGLITGAGPGMLQLSGNGAGGTNCTCVGPGC